MVRPFRRVALAILLLAPVRLRAQADPAVTVFIVRHAEKADQSTDPSLSQPGAERARALARLLHDAHITSIYVSQFKRTQETAAPVAKAEHQESRVVDAGKPDELVAELKRLPAGSRALVVSHSNLVPVVIEKLTGQKVGELTDSDYDRIYVVTLSPAGGSVVYLHFGAGAGGE